MRIYDDGSADNTLEIAARFSGRDSRFKIVAGPHLGIVGALVQAIASTDAPFLARMDGDDISHPRRLEETMALLDDRPGVAVASTLVAGFPDGGVGPGMARYIDWLNSRVTATEIARDIFVESPICHPSVIMRRDAYDQVGGYVDDGGPEDYGLWLRFHGYGFQMAKHPAVRFFWRDSRHRLSRTDTRYGRDRFVTAKTAALEELFLGSARTIVIWGAGKIGRMFSRSLATRGFPPAAFIDVDPKKVGRTVHGVPVVGMPSCKADVPGDLILSAVGSEGAREKIRAHLTQLGLREHCHFVSVA